MATRDDEKRHAGPRDDRARRLEAALRDNLKKRKQLVRARQDKAAQPQPAKPVARPENGDDPEAG